MNFQWQRLLIVVHGLVPGRFFANDPLDVDYNVDLGGDSRAADTSEFAESADARESARREAEDYVPPDDTRAARGDEEHEELPEERGREDGRRDVARERAQRDTRGGDERGRRRERVPNDLPEHRYQRLEARFNQTVQLLNQQIAQANRRERQLRTALDLPERQEQRRWSPQEQRIRTQLERTYPELAVLRDERLQRLLQRAQDIDRMATDYPQRGEEESRRWGGHAERMVRQTLNHAATQWLGKGKTAADLDEDDRDEIDQTFTRWLVKRAEREEKDLPNGQFGETTLRYESGDPSLVNEFWTWFTRRHAGAGPGGQRQNGAAAAARADAAARAPRGGSSSAPVGSARREVKTATLDDAIDEAWESVRNARAGA